MEDQPQVKRKRRPSVRSGEIGVVGPYDASELWLETLNQRMQPLWKKPPRIRSLENVGDKAVVVVEECSVDEASVMSVDEEKVVAGVGPSRMLAKQLQHVKLRVGQSARKPAVGNVQGKTQEPRVLRLTWNGNRVRRKHVDSSQPRSLVDADPLEERKDEAEGERIQLRTFSDDEAPFLAGMSSALVGLMGSELMGPEEVLPADDYGNGASDHSEEGGGDSNLNSPCKSGGVLAKQQKCIIFIPANPRSNGDGIQGAIDDGSRQAAAKGSSTVKQYEVDLRLGRQAARRSNSITDIVCRDHSRDILGRDTAGGRFQASPSVAKGAIVATPSHIQRVKSLSAGVSEWLLDLGLGKYSELFSLNEVDTEVLPLLTMSDLREMGVDAVGARRKMFTHIQELGQLR